MRAILTAVMLTALAVPGAAQAEPYWQTIDNCGHGHRSQVAKKRITTLLHAPYVKRAKVRHYNRCVATRAKRRYLTRVVKNGWEWRAANYWLIRFERIPADWQAWLHAVAHCESKHGTDPETNSNGFRGIFQWVLSTWYGAGGTGDPAVAGFYHEAVIAYGLATSSGTHHWPNCP